MDPAHPTHNIPPDQRNTVHISPPIDSTSSTDPLRPLRSSRTRLHPKPADDTASPSAPPNPQPSSAATSPLAPRRRTRASAAAEQLQQHPQQPSPTPSIAATAQDKGKKRAVEEELVRHNSRPRRAAAARGIVINEPPRDPKGKKRAAPSSDEEALPPTSKRRRTTATRSKAALSSGSKQSKGKGRLDMPRKPRVSAKGKDPVMKEKAPEAETSVQDEDGDFVMHEGSAGSGASEDENDEEHPDEPDNHYDEEEEENSGEESEEDEDAGHTVTLNPTDGRSGAPSSGTSGRSQVFEDPTAALFGGDFRTLGGYMLGLNSRLKTILTNIKSTDSTQRLMALQELSEVLSVSTEDTLAGHFQVESFVRELLKIMGGTGMPEDDEHGDDEERDEDEENEGLPSHRAGGGNAGAVSGSAAGEAVLGLDDMDEDAALAAALAMSGGGGMMNNIDVEAQVLACRCLANLMEALPGCSHTIVYHGAVPVLTGKLVQIEYIDLAEQTLSTLEKISQEFPNSIVRAGGLSALLNFIDFFSTSVQRTALSAAANCCRSVSPDNVGMVREVFPIIRNVLGYSDQRLVESACICVIRILDSYRSRSDLLEGFMDADLVASINALLLPAGGSPLITPNTYTLLLRSLTNTAKASPKAAITLLEGGIVDTLYQILTGVLPPMSDDGAEQGQGGQGQGLGGGIADMAVMQNLAHRPREQIEEALGLICELMPPTPKEGIFDAKGYTEKSLNKLLKAKRKSDRAAARAAAGGAPSAPLSPSAGPLEDGPANNGGESDELSLPPPVAIKEDPDAPLTRTDLFRANPEVAGRFMKLMVPVLIDVYAASVALSLRTKTMSSIIKAVGFLSGDELREIVRRVPVASFVGSIVSSGDHASLVVSALSLVELLLTKLPDIYKPALRREGVLNEIDLLADRELKTKAPSKKDAAPEQGPPELQSVVPPPFSVQAIALGKRHSSHVIDPQDVVTLRARVIRAKGLVNMKEDGSDSAFEELARLAGTLRDSDSSDADLKKALKAAAVFFPTEDSVSSFELMKSGLVEALLEFATADDRKVPVSRRQAMLLEVFSTPLANYPTSTPFAVLVKRLQELLTRLENFDVVTLSQTDDPKRGAVSMLTRQVRIRLVAEDGTDLPRAYADYSTSVQAILTFHALEQYMHRKITHHAPAAKLSSVLAAFAAATGMPPGVLRDVGEGSSTAGSSTQATRGTPSKPRAGTRRSLRLSGEGGLGSAIQEPAAASSAAATSSVQPPAPAAAGIGRLAAPRGMPGAFLDHDAIGEVVDDEDEVSPTAEKTVDLKVSADGTKVVAETPGGTRVATPNNAGLAAAGGSVPSLLRASYAAALKTAPSDWHLEFTVDDQACPMDATLFGVLYQNQLRKLGGSNVVLGSFWSTYHTIKYKKVSGPMGEASNGDISSPRPEGAQLSSMPADAAHSAILSLLKVLYTLNAEWIDRALPSGSGDPLAASAFVNNKLSAKLTRQMEEIMIVASSCLPDWSLELPQNFPFLFPFATRYQFVQSTSLGYARLILKWQSQNPREVDSSRRNDGMRNLGQLKRQKLRISRSQILESLVKIVDMGYAKSSSVLEIEFYDEVGTGLGPTLEFYSLASREFARRDLRMWRDADSSQRGPYVHHPTGLFPVPFPTDVNAEVAKRKLHLFRVLGQFVGKGILDSRIIDVHFNKVFMKMLRGEEVPLTLNSLRVVDPALAKSLAQIQAFADEKAGILADATMDELDKDEAISTLNLQGLTLEDLALDFTAPGHDIELLRNGRSISVTADNVEEYLKLSLEALIGKGVAKQIQAFKDGFSTVIPVRDMQTFTAEELAMMFGNSDEDWSSETLSEVIKADHGFTSDSRAIRSLVDIMANLDLQTRREMLQFITGSPKLPIGGFRGLNPPLTVVRKPHEPPLSADDYLPSVMTCVNYLKLPEYSTEEVMLRKLKVAIKEGMGSFHLS